MPFTTVARQNATIENQVLWFINLLKVPSTFKEEHVGQNLNKRMLASL